MRAYDRRWLKQFEPYSEDLPLGITLWRVRGDEVAIELDHSWPRNLSIRLGDMVGWRHGSRVRQGKVLGFYLNSNTPALHIAPALKGGGTGIAFGLAIERVVSVWEAS